MLKNKQVGSEKGTMTIVSIGFPCHNDMKNILNKKNVCSEGWGYNIHVLLQTVDLTVKQNNPM